MARDFLMRDVEMMLCKQRKLPPIYLQRVSISQERRSTRIMGPSQNKSLFRRCLNYFGARFQRFSLNAQIQAERRNLLKLDDHALKDIGVSRKDADNESRRSFGDIPHNRVTEVPRLENQQTNFSICGLCGRRFASQS